MSRLDLLTEKMDQDGDTRLLPVKLVNYDE